jgi:hypothetical protein
VRVFTNKIATSPWIANDGSILQQRRDTMSNTITMSRSGNLANLRFRTGAITLRNGNNITNEESNLVVSLEIFKRGSSQSSTEHGAESRISVEIHARKSRPKKVPNHKSYQNYTNKNFINLCQEPRYKSPPASDNQVLKVLP